MLKRTVEGYPYEEFIYCGCGCGKTRSRVNSSGNIRTHLAGHGIKGKKRPEETRKKMSLWQIGENNNQWKGDSQNLGYDGIHRRVRVKFPKPNLCQMCKQKPPRDLACLTGIYNDDVVNWAYLCRKCHQKWDNIPERNFRKRWERGLLI